MEYNSVCNKIGKNLRLVILGVFTAFLTACTMQQISPSGTSGVAGVITEGYSEIERAKQYEQQAMRSEGDVKTQNILMSAHFYALARRYQQASHILNALPFTSLPKEQQNLYHLIESRILLAEGKTNQAMTILTTPPAKQYLSPNFLFEWYEMLAIGYLHQRKPFDSVKTRILLSNMMEQMLQSSSSTNNWQPSLDEQLDKQLDAIWSTLLMLPLNSLNNELADLNASANNNDFKAWLELSIVAKRYTEQPENLISAIEAWQVRYPNHLARLILPNSSVIVSSEQAIRQATQVALLLPLSGQYASFGEAIKNGFVAAFYESLSDSYQDISQELPTTIRFYNTAERDIERVYDEAVIDGADFIVGPLQGSNLKRLNQYQKSLNKSTMRERVIPVLGINYLDDDQMAAPTLFQFGLKPEDEALSAAQNAWAHGYTKAITLSSRADWAIRSADAFKQEFESLGGTILDSESVGTVTEVNLAIKRLLKINDSEARNREVGRTIGASLEFEARPRSDVEVMYVALDNAQTQQVTPLMKFYFSGDIPIYSASRMYRFNNNPVDLNGLMFCDAPWVLNDRQQDLKESLKTLWPGSEQANARLYALGIDAYGLLWALNQMQLFSDYTLAGVSGDLYLSEMQEVRRLLSCARLVDGKAVLLSTPDLSP